MPDPVIVSVGTSTIGRTALTARDLFTAALTEAFTGLPDPAELVEALYVGNQSESYEHQIMYGTLLAEWAGLRGIPGERVEGCAAAGALALRHAVKDVRSGEHEAVLAAGVERMTGAETAGATDALSAATELALEQRSGLTAPAGYALLAQRYMHEFDVTEADLAEIAVKNHRNAAANPRAQFTSTVDVETVLDSDYIAPPLKLFDCAPISDGSAAVLVTTQELADELVTRDDQVRVTGSGAAVNNLAVADRDPTWMAGAATASESARTEAGIEPEDIDIAEVHDAFTVCEPLISEAVGFAPRGRGSEVAFDPADRSPGWTDVRLSTSGGLKARGHPIGATGLLQAVEAYEQLTGRAGGRQVADAATALLMNEGGVSDAVIVAHVLEGAV